MWALASIQYLTVTLCPSTTGVLAKGHCLLKQEVLEAVFLPRKVTVTIPLDCTKVLAVMVNTQVSESEKRRQKGRGEPSGLITPFTGLEGS